MKFFKRLISFLLLLNITTVLAFEEFRKRFWTSAGVVERFLGRVINQRTTEPIRAITTVPIKKIRFIFIDLCRPLQSRNLVHLIQ